MKRLQLAFVHPRAISQCWISAHMCCYLVAVYLTWFSILLLSCLRCFPSLRRISMIWKDFRKALGQCTVEDYPILWIEKTKLPKLQTYSIKEALLPCAALVSTSCLCDPGQQRVPKPCISSDL